MSPPSKLFKDSILVSYIKSVGKLLFKGVAKEGQPRKKWNFSLVYTLWVLLILRMTYTMQKISAQSP